MQLDVDRGVAVLTQPIDGFANRRLEDSMFPCDERFHIAKILQQLSRPLGIVLVDQQVDVGHGTIARHIDSDGVQRGTLERNDGQPGSTRASVNAFQQRRNASMTKLDVFALALKKPSP